MCLSCKYVDDVVIGAPYDINIDLINFLKIKKVINVVDTDEDLVLPKYLRIDPYTTAKHLGKYYELSIDDQFYDVTTESIA